VEQPLQEIRPPLVAHPEPAVAEESGERALYHPAVPAQSLRRVDTPSSKAWGDAATGEGTTQVGRVIRFVGVEFGRALAAATGSPSWSEDRRDSIDERKELRRIVGISLGEPDGKGNAVSIDDQVVFGARLAAVNGVWPRPLAPLLARTLSESTLARDQSIADSSPNQFRSISCSRC
jgi:hypothetical protein